MKGLDEDEAVSLLVNSVKKYSPSGREVEASRFFTSAMNDHAFRRVRTDRAGNAIGEAGTGKVHILLCGHIDTIPGQIPIMLRNGRLSGRGSVDAKSPMCAMLVAASRFIDDPMLRLTLACVTGEEGDSVGIRTLMDDKTSYEFAVFGEPGGVGRVTVGYRGRTSLHVSLATESGHAGSSWAYRNAFDEATSLICRLRDYENEHSRDGDHYHSVSVSPTLFEAGEYRNVIPSHAEFTCDIRVPQGLRCAVVQKELGRVITSFLRSKRVNVDYHFEESTDPYEAQPSSLLIRAFQRGILLQAKSRPILLKKTGTGDMNTFASMKRAECVTYGPGEANLSHTSRESVRISDYLQSIEVLSEALNQVKQLRKSGNGE